MQQGRKTGVSEFLQGQTGNHRFLIPVKKCLDSRDCFCFKLVGGLWLAKAKLVIDKTHIHENQRNVLHVVLSTNGILKKL